MTVKEFNTTATPKSRTRTIYENTPTVVYSETVTNTGDVTLPSDEDIENEKEISITEVLPLPGFMTKLYVDPVKREALVWISPKEGEGEGHYEKVANIRVHATPRADFPEEGIEGWLYIATDKSLVFVWDGTAYVNASGVVEIEAELPLEVEYEDEDTKHLAKMSIKKATTSDVGVVKPDGTTITVDSTGKITGTKITAGSNITISPTTGVGDVTINVPNAITSISGGSNISVSGSGNSRTISYTGSSFPGFSSCPYYGHYGKDKGCSEGFCELVLHELKENADFRSAVAALVAEEIKKG